MRTGVLLLVALLTVPAVAFGQTPTPARSDSVTLWVLDKYGGVQVFPTPTPTPPQEIVIHLPNGVTMEMVLIPAGSFEMGDSFSEGGSDERPVHAVTVSAFYMDRYEVSNDEMVEVMQWAYDNGRSRHQL